MSTDMKIGDEVIDAAGKAWQVLNAPCDIDGAESPGLFREYNPDGTLGGRQGYGTSLPKPLVLWPTA